MTKILGTVLASPIVQGASDLDAYATHYSHLGMGGYQELPTLSERDSIPVDPLSRLEHTGATAMGSGRRRLGMLVYVAETNIVYQLNVPYPTWTGLTTVNKVSALADNNNWIEFSTGSGGGDAIKKRYPQVGHGFQIGQVIAYDGAQFVLKSSAQGDNNETLGLVSRIDDVDNFTLTYAGFFDASSITGLSASTVYFVSPFTAGAITPDAPLGLGDENRPILIMQTPSTGIVVQYRGQIITEITGASGTTTNVIGPAEDGTYTDGLFTDFVPTTPTGTAVDRFNEVLKALAPSPAPDLTSILNSPTLNSANLSFGASHLIAPYSAVTAAAGNSVVDINGAYLVAGTRRGVTNVAVSGQLNSSVPLTSSHAAGAFGEGNIGKLQMYVNGVLINSIMLSGTTAATSNTKFSLSAVSAVTFTNNDPFNFFKYRTGTFTVATTSMVSGFNYMRILHVKPSGTVQTNYLEWVHDPNANAIVIGASTFTGLTLTGSRFISGVRYSTGGTVAYNTSRTNAYRNIYQNGNAISYPSRSNLSDSVIITKTGTGLTTNISASKTLALLNTGLTNSHLTPVFLSSTHTLQNNILGNLGATGKIETNSLVLHPLKATAAGGVVSTSGFLQYQTIQSNNIKIENFTGEVNRLQNRDYTAISYAAIDAGTHAWTGSQNLVSGDAFHNTGLLVFNGELIYPNAAYLTSQYGITTGNFTLLTNILGGNPNYTTAAGIRYHSRKFKSANAITQSTLTIEFLHTGSNSSFLTDGGIGGTPTGNFIKVEVMIKRVGGSTHGWFNPFASTGNPEGIANTALSTIVGGTSVSCTLSTVPRIGDTDIVIVRVLTASGWTNRISNINIVNI